MNELRVKNHYVPELYLKQWENISNKVCVYRTLVSHQNQRIWKKHSSGAIAYQRHLYTQVISGVEYDEFERWIDMHYESPAKDAIEKATSDRRLSKDDWDVLIRFLACQDVRTPARLLEHLNREHSEYQKTLQDSVERVKYELENNIITPDDAPEENNEIDRQYPLKVITELDPKSDMGLLRVESYIGRATWLHSIKHLLENTEKVLHEHKWSIIKPAKGYSWFTSDNPVVKLNFTDDTNYDFGGGWCREKGNIIFPIGPQHAMFVQIGDKPVLKGTRLNEPLTRQLRKFIAEHSHRMIFSNRFDDEMILLRPRVVNYKAVISERKQIESWHEQNKQLETEYLK